MLTRDSAFNLAVLTSVCLPQAPVDIFGVLLALTVAAVLKGRVFTSITEPVFS